MLGTLRKLLGRGSGSAATDGGTDVATTTFDGRERRAVRERYGVDRRGLDPALPDEAVDHLDSLLDENAPTETYVPAYREAGVDPAAFVAARDAPVDAVFSRLREEGVDGERVDRTETEPRTGLDAVVEDAAAASERIVAVTREQSEAAGELSERVDRLTDQNE